MKFKVWLESYQDIFGFNDDSLPLSAIKLKRPDDLPIQPFPLNEMMFHLSSKRIGEYEPFQRFLTECQWGINPGAVRVRLGTGYNVYLERLLHDLEGSPVWITKSVFRINIDDYKDYPHSVSDALHEQSVKIMEQPLDGPTKEYSQIQDLVDIMKDKFKEKGHEFFVFEGVKKVNECNYIIQFGARGGGVGALSKKRSEGKVNEVTVDISFNEQVGLLHVIVSTVLSGDEGVSWEIAPAFFEGWYTPTQTDQEIIESVLTAVKYF